MKHLKINDNKGFFTVGERTAPVDQITKEDLFDLLNLAIEEDDFVMDTYSDESIQNQAHRIIYKNIYDKLDSLRSNRQQFRDEVDRLYKDAIDKYAGQNPAVELPE
jgi:hypothetical protein